MQQTSQQKAVFVHPLPQGNGYYILLSFLWQADLGMRASKIAKLTLAQDQDQF